MQLRQFKSDRNAQKVQALATAALSYQLTFTFPVAVKRRNPTRIPDNIRDIAASLDRFYYHIKSNTQELKSSSPLFGLLSELLPLIKQFKDESNFWNDEGQRPEMKMKWTKAFVDVATVSFTFSLICVRL